MTRQLWLPKLNASDATTTHKAFMEKVERIKSCLLMKYDVETKLLTLEDM